MSLAVNWSKAKMTEQNPIGLYGVDFIEYAGSDAAHFQKLFTKLGFTELAKIENKEIRLYRQGDINFIINCEPDTFATDFAKLHGPSVSSTGFRVENATRAFEEAVKRGARPYDGSQSARGATPYLAIYGIGDSLVYFIDETTHNDLYEKQFKVANNATNHPVGLGLEIVDHFTNNVPVGEMKKWADFYENIFNFHEAKYFDIKGKATGLLSKAMRSPCGLFSVPINEPKDAKSQIQEYLNEYKGSGIQHIAMTTQQVIPTLERLRAQGIEFLAAPPDTYYGMLKDRLPQVSEDIDKLKGQAILVDGDQHGYLLQIFTKNVIGPVFYEVIQRKGHDGFGDGNFQALFDAIEADQRARGYL
ncbi:4-hydroxyphenylpyruvate dioxygenase [Pseudobdellovibrio exovorus]|uniref:4-hydroxyphenylpyruvate dioxygenase n=1 Tax=Pseudobdellovibrio exovorus JSS TaxID=1184267 RepID=M4VAR8_9BACT|nr:4-hydroxyphenylpyruvate dioxygenase [Pseudobdellovibrio exovorus]AGH96467.1 4-hydroxyphenylpyruvate dioxygenase [Pseudobdellovibrio exovorus JSS]